MSFSEMDFSSPLFSTLFREQIKKIIMEEINQLAFDKTYPAIITNTPSGGLANISLYGTVGSTPTIIQNVKIRPGLSPSKDQKVYVKAINGSLNNLMIDFY